MHTGVRRLLLLSGTSLVIHHWTFVTWLLGEMIRPRIERLQLNEQLGGVQAKIEAC